MPTGGTAPGWLAGTRQKVQMSSTVRPARLLDMPHEHLGYVMICVKALCACGRRQATACLQQNTATNVRDLVLRCSTLPST